MIKGILNTGKATLLTVAVALLAVFVSVPAGAKDKKLTKSELKNLIANAETKAEHEKIARYFDVEAARYEAESRDHGELAPFYQRNPDPTISKHPGSPRSFQHCDSLSKELQQAAADARALAAEHRELAKEAKK